MFGRTRHDRLFARFVARGDVSALGEVFDATAPELMRIAAHLVGDRELARDLVQSTFLIALERRGDFAGERRVLPWLCGIVANLARSERRRRRRVLELQSAPVAVDPGAAAEAAELHAAFARAKGDLPEVYRPVIELHLEHGLNATEIGSVLGRPAGTVRTQIVRALAGLRQRLPREFVAGSALLSLGRTDLSVDLNPMRVLVLGRARDLTPAGAAAGSISWTVLAAEAMNKKLLIIAALGVLAALGIWAAALQFGFLTGEAEVAATWIVRPARAERAEARTSTATAPPAERTPMPAPIVTAPTGTLEVMARWASDAAPAGALAIDVIYEHETLGELQPRRVVTDTEGRARFTDLPAGAVSVQASTGVQRAAEVRGGEVSSVVLELEGTRVRGRVVDHGGTPVADADVWVSSELCYTPSHRAGIPGHGQYGERVLRTDAQGAFETRLAPVQCLAASKPGYGPSPTTYPLRGLRLAGRSEVSVELRLREGGATLDVTVHDPRGGPVHDALVLAGEEVPTLTGEENQASPPALRARTDAQGVAVLTPLPTGRIPVVVRASGFGPWIGVVHLPGNPPGTGAVPLVVTLAEGAVIAGVVRDANGAPLSDALVSHGTIASLSASRARTDSLGTYRLENLPAGEVEVVASHPGWGAVTSTLTTVAGATQTWDPCMPARAAITGRVFDEAGRPAAGTYLTGVVSGNHARGRYANTTADAGGRFVLAPLDPGQSYDLRAEIPRPSGGHVVAHRRGVPVDSEIEVYARAEDAPSARLHGRLVHRDGRPAAGYLLVTTPLDNGPSTTVLIGADGSFTLGPWPPARVRLAAQRGESGPPLADFGVHELRTDVDEPLGDLVLPPSGSLRVQLAGGAVERAVVELFRDGALVDARRTSGTSLAWDELAPGTYTVSARARRDRALLAGVADAHVVGDAIAETIVPLAGATRRQIRFATADGISIGLVTLRAVDASGRTVLVDTVAASPDEPTDVALPDATVVLHAETASGWHGHTPVGAAADRPLVLHLERAK